MSSSSTAVTEVPLSTSGRDESPRRRSVPTLRRWLAVQWVFLEVALLVVAQVTGLRWIAARLARRPYERLTAPIALRRAFEELGPTYIKLGQMIASSDGLFPKRYAEEFRKCLDSVPPFAFEHVEATVREELGGAPSEIFATFDE